MKIEMSYPEIFVTGVIPADMPKLSQLAHALSAWGACHCGNDLPEYFGEVMTEIGSNLGILTTPDGCSEAFKQWKDAGKPLDFFDKK